MRLGRAPYPIHSVSQEFDWLGAWRDKKGFGKCLAKNRQANLMEGPSYAPSASPKGTLTSVADVELQALPPLCGAIQRS